MAYKKLKYWFDEALVERLANEIGNTSTSFNQTRFVQGIQQTLEPLELKDRVEVIADKLQEGFKGDYQTGVSTLMEILGPENEKETGMFTDYYWIMPIAKFVEKYGLNHFSLSMEAIAAITKRNTGEYAIRPFLDQHTENTLEQMKRWSTSTNKHLRRLSSEGVRPRLPWAKKLDIFIDNPQPIIPILDTLKDDPSKYVQKSVANCTNDILKDNVDAGKALIERWKMNDMSNERKWIIKHALRNLLKTKDPWAIEMIQ